MARAWSVLGGSVFLTARVTGHEILWQPLVIGLVAITATYYVVRRHRTTWLLGLPLLMALLYGIFYVGVNRVLIAESEMRLAQSASRIAAAIEEFLPVVCDHGVDIPACFVISHSIGRPLQRHYPSHRAYLLVTTRQYEVQAHRQLIAQAAHWHSGRLPGIKGAGGVRRNG